MKKIEGTQEKDNKKDMESNVSREITPKEMEKVTGGTIRIDVGPRRPR